MNTDLHGETLADAPTPSRTSDRFLTASNLLSILRAVLVVPFVMITLSTVANARFWGAVVVVIAALTDKLDGMLARKYGDVTEWGKILDPLADKIGVAALAIVLIVLNAIPAWFLFLIVGRDLLIFGGGVFLKATRNLILPSNETGKWAVGVVSLTLFLSLLGVQSVAVMVLIWTSVAMLCLSFILYVKRFVEVMNSPQSR